MKFLFDSQWYYPNAIQKISLPKHKIKKIMYFKSINSIFFVLNIHLPAAEEVIFISVVRKNDAILVMDL